jgi:hypothetical protein
MDETPDRAAREAIARRNFLKRCGKFAIVTPPTMTVLLSTSLDSPAVAASGGGGNCNLICRLFENF